MTELFKIITVVLSNIINLFNQSCEILLKNEIFQLIIGIVVLGIIIGIIFKIIYMLFIEYEYRKCRKFSNSIDLEPIPDYLMAEYHNDLGWDKYGNIVDLNTFEVVKYKSK